MGYTGGAALSGALSGASMGSSFGPYGAAIGAIVGAGAGFVKAKKNEADLALAQEKIDASKKLIPSEVDPELLAMKRGYDRLAQNYAGRAGQEYMKNNLASTTQNAIAQAFKYSGGNFNVSSLKDIYHTGLFGINQQAQQAQQAMMERSSAIQDAMSQRKLEIQMAKYQQGLAEGMSDKQAALANISGDKATQNGDTINGISALQGALGKISTDYTYYKTKKQVDDNPIGTLKSKPLQTITTLG